MSKKVAKKSVETTTKPVENVVNKVRYFCFACTGRVLYAPSPFKFEMQVCPKCEKVHDHSNYRAENWLPILPGETE